MPKSDDVAVPNELDTLTNELDQRIESLAHGNEHIQNAALFAAKYIFDLSLGTERGSKPAIDELLSSLNPLQKPQTRSQSKADNPMPQVSSPKTFESTPVSSLFVENMDTEQLWMQFDLRARTVCDLLDFALETGKSDDEENPGETEEEGDLQKMMEAIEKGEEVDFDALEEEFEEDEDMEEGSDSESDGESDGESGGLEDIVDEDEDVVHLQESDEDTSDSETKSTLFDIIKSAAGSKKKKPASHGLNDDFFDLDAFNAETEKAEARSSSRGRLADDDDASEDENMSVDLFAPLDDEEEAEGAADIYYRDFFAVQKNVDPQSPPKLGGRSGNEGRVRFHDEVRVKKIKAKGKNLPLSFLYGNGMDDMEDDEDIQEDEDTQDDEGDGEDMESEKDGWGVEDELMGSEDDDGMLRGDSDEDGGEESESMSQSLASEEDNREIIERLKDDLFADDDDTNNISGMTTHERLQAALREQIAQLETENVAKKEWTLMGEADSRSRPQNSLLEEDLDFERVMKPIPLISEDVVQGLEQRIKARISENQFDDVVRVRPLEDKPFLPSRIIELQDTKSTQSLAQIYEKDYLTSQGSAVDDRDGKLKKEHEEIEQQWEKICSKLDALCNAHFVPKQPKAVISTISNVATASLESALPTAKATTSILAPEEVFNPSTSETRARSELTPTEKRVLRMRERKAKKKQRQTLEKSVDKVAKVSRGISGAKKEKQTALQNIVKTGKGVTVVGKQASSLTSTKKRQKV